MYSKRCIAVNVLFQKLDEPHKEDKYFIIYKFKVGNSKASFMSFKMGILR